ncbi:Meiotic recombination protein rec8 [Tolypocladium capitatum]|uniref:Meiotic recombination protein rec8 n=1 Tax=Tolypocladium capitatum TaxID=45235 RepID=A0A2K3QI59_9HYPO|nr:Meiotic recombination protein rec8 [Tolypocladium capitatum]
MFYSHDILSNSQYGVATIWLAATVSKGTAAGNGAFRRLTRKAVQEVNVPKACETIIDPGAPLALRLQGSLLYGVSRVFAQQCGYMLSDAEKTQSDMMTFFRVLQTSETDPRAGKTKRHLIMLQDDPAFDLSSALPILELLRGDKELFGVPSQGSVNKFSQMTPRGGSSQGLSSTRNQALLPFDFPSPSHCGGIYRLPSEFGHHSSPLANRNRESDIMPEFQPFGDDELDPINGIGLDFDADGNLVGIIEEELELPPLSGASAYQVQHVHGGMDALGEAEEHLVLGGGDEPALIMGEEALPDADAFPVQPTDRRASDSYAKASETTETTETEQASAKNRRGHRRKARLMLDQTDHVSRAEFRSWNDNYVENMDASRKRVKKTTPAQAKKNALAFIYGNRIAGIGIANGVLGVAHPLAEEFAGKGLEARLHELVPDEIDFGVAETRGRRRKSPEAFGDEQAEEEYRNVRQRADGDAELGRGDDQGDCEPLVFGDESAPEIGMNAAAPLDDRHSSSMMPWSQPASVVRRQGSAQKPAPSPSPLHRRGSVIGSIERHSDPGEAPLGAAGFGSQDSSVDFGGAIGVLDFGRGNDTQASSAGLDIDSQEFLGFVAEQAGEKGVTRDRDKEDRRWVEFDELANPEVHSKAVAAQAFLYVLSFASKSSIVVEQDGADHKVPFGTIRIGIIVSRGRAASVDELA